MASIDENLQLDSDFTAATYVPFAVAQNIDISGTAPGGVVTTIDGDSGGGASGPIVTFSGGATGIGFQAVGTSVTLVITNAATTRAALGVPLIHTAAIAPTTADDGAAGYPIGSLWVDTVLQNGFISVDSSAAAAVWKQIT